MRNFSWWVTVPILICGFLSLGTIEANAQKPDFSGVWILDIDRSDDLKERVRAGAGDTTKLTRMDIQQLVDRVTQLAQAAEELELEQSMDDLKVFDKEDNVRIYYIDGKKHPRQTPWGAKLQTTANWNEDRLVVVTEGKEIGKITEVYTLEGEQLVFVIQLEHKDFDDTVIARHYYDRQAGR